MNGNMKIKENAPILETGDFWYDLFAGGYIKVADYLDEPELTKLLEAKQMLEDFRDSLEDNDLIELL